MNTLNMNIADSARRLNPVAVKASICTVAVLSIAYIVLFQGGESAVAAKGTRAAEGIQMTSLQAEDMSRTADKVSDLIEGASGHPALATDLGMNTGTEAGIDEVSEATKVWYVRRIEVLFESWGPDYAAAKSEIDRFEHRFRTSEDRLREYFDEQTELTERVNDPNLRADLQRRDEEERAAYLRWTTEGRKLLDRALAMRSELDDMDIVIRKQHLTVSMLSQYTRDSSIPESAENLHRSLAEFRLQSDALATDLSIRVFN